jgi:hypothetical protein
MMWRFDSGLDDKAGLDRHIRNLLMWAETRAEAIRRLSPDYAVTLQCVGYYPASGHGCHFTRDTLQAAAYLGLEIDLDFYYVDGHDHD